MAALPIMLVPAGRAAADPIDLAIQVRGGTVEVLSNPDQPTASFSLFGNHGFRLNGAGVSLVPGGCDPCFGGTQTGLPGVVFAHNGQVTVGNRTGAFDLFIGGGGEFDFTADSFTLPAASSKPLVFTASFMMMGRISAGPEDIGGSLANVAFDLSGSGIGKATFVPRDFIPGLGQEFVFESARYDFASTPEPGTLVLIGAGAVSFARRRSRTDNSRDGRESRSVDWPGRSS
jgi:hypothetical protein